MKALTYILTRLLMLMLLMLVACTEETAEVDNLTRGEQYVTVRMNIPGMTATATRAADGVIESVTALAFDTNGSLLKVVSATNITTERFNLTVPNGTKNIHFLANYNGDLSAVQEEIDLTTLTTNDYENLVYWGMTTYEGTTNTLSTTLYRNMAKITLAPDEEFPFEGELTIAGLTNPNNWGYLVPWKDGVYTDGRVPNEPDPLTLTPIGKDGAGYGTSLYVLEHDNPNTNDGLYVICRIGDAFYKVALTSNGIDPYKIKRNHEYIIYVSDVDDYQADEYRTAIGDNIKDDYDIAAGKKPINLEVKELESVTFGETPQSIDVDGNLTVTMTVPEDGTVTALTISAPGFTIEQGGSYIGNGLNIVGNSNVTYTFVPNTFGKGKKITFTASGTNLQETIKNIYVDVNAAISASPTVNNPTLYYDQDGQTVTVNVTMPKGLSEISIGGAENFMVTPPAQGTFNNNVYTRTEATTTQEVQFVFTLDKSKYTSQQGDTSATFTFSDASTAVDKATSASVNNISLKPTFTYIDNPTLNMNNNETYTVTMNVGGSLTSLSIAAEGFTVASSSGELTGPTNNVYSYAGGTTTFTFTPTSAGSRTIRFYSGEGVNINVPEKNINVTVNATIDAEADKETIYHDGNDKTVTVSVTIPKGVSGLNISATNFSYGDDTDGVYTYDRTDGATTQEQVDFVFTLKDGVTEDSSITFSDASANENVSSATVDINVEATPVVTSNMSITPSSAALDLSTSPSASVTLTLTKPANVTDIRISGLDKFDIALSPNATNSWFNGGYYYYQGLTAQQIELTLTIKSQYLATAGNYTITFYEGINAETQSESISATIQVKTNYADGVIWEGEKTINWDPGLNISYNALVDYRGKTILMDVENNGQDWQINVNGIKQIQRDSNNPQPTEMTIELPIPSDLNNDVKITGIGVTVKKLYISSTSE